jgi:RNA recognition motif-containing protein
MVQQTVTTQGGGFTQVHVSGLLPDCDDAELEAALRRLLVDAKSRTSGSSVTGAEAPAAETDALQGLPMPEAESPQAGTEDESHGTLVVAEVDADPRRDLEVQADEKTSGIVSEGTVPADTRDREPADATGSDTEAAQEEPEEDAAGAEDELALLEAMVSCTVVRHKETFECKGYCFLTFASPEEAQAAILALNGASAPRAPELSAQISQPKERFAPKKDPYEHLNDLRIRRQRYPGLSKKAQYGHFNNPGARKVDADGGESGPPKRNAAGRLTGVSGTRSGNRGGDRGGNKGTLQHATDAKKNSGFRNAL